MAGSGHGTRKGWDVPSERPELNSEVQRNLNAKNSLRNEQDENQLNNDYPDLNVHDRYPPAFKANIDLKKSFASGNLLFRYYGTFRMEFYRQRNLQR